MYTSTSNLKPPHANPLSPFHTRHLRPNRRRRLKQQQKHVARAKPLVLCSASLLNPFQDFISRFPSPISLDLLAPALGLASGVSLYVSRLKKPGAPGDACEIGEWIFFTSPTPFNRFVLLRCPSVSFQGSEFLEDVNEKLVEEDRHFVRLNSGRIYSRGERGGDGLEDKLEYQRVCVNTKDGGVVSLDWPADLDLNEEHGLDTTLILVPGTAEGSMEENVRSFVVEALKRGFFPVVMNPRGCAGSPLTTARLFTAADSDDISTATQFINKARPWTTLMGVGWGFGANMLTKYLGEVGDKTPLTAATCINNPFDLEEATRCSPYRNALDEKLTSGMIEILQSNKELFQGRTKRFDVETALSAKSVRDFEKAISMVSYGFGEIEDFYSKSSTTSVVGNVGIPVLFIQNDDGTAPLFSIPRSLIAENPFTSLLLCSCPPSSIIASERAAISWCQNLTVEWFTAVELGLLKGRHPLLNDVDVNINPIKGLSPVENRVSAKGAKLNKLLDVTLTEATEPLGKTPEDANTVPTLHFNARGPSPGHLELEAGLQELLNGPLQPTNSIDAELIREQGYSSVDTVTSLAVPTAEVVMNMLDASMPDILSEEEKKKVLTAVSQGETLLRALETAVPLEVRGKITTAVSEIVQTQQSSLNFDRLLGISKIPSASTGVNTKSQEKAREVSGAQTLPKDQHSSEKMKRTDDLAGSSGNNQLGLETSGIGQEPELHPSEHIQKSSGLDQSQPVASQPGDTSASFRKPVIESVNNYANDEVNKEKTAPSSDNSEKRLETSTIANLNSQTEKVGGIEEAVVDDSKAAQGGGTHQLEMKRESNIQKTEEKPVGSSADHGKVELGSASEETLSPTGSSSDPQAMERENKNIQPAVDQSKPATPDSTPATFSVAQALDALTGMDDSTQVAVNSVFGVIENMISQLEEEKDDENKMEDTIEVKNEATGSASKKQHTTSDQEPKITENGNNNLHIQSDTFQESPMHKDIRNNVDSQAIASTGWLEEEPTKDSISFPGNNASDSPQDSNPNYEAKEEKDNDQILGSRSLADYSYGNKIDFPLYVTVNPYGDYIHKEYLRRYLLSKISNGKKLDLDTTTALFLDYFPEDGQWKLLEQTGDVDESTAGGVSTHDGMKENQADEYIEPSYVVLDTGRQHEHVAKYNTLDNFTDNVENDGDQLKLMQSVRTVILNALKVEVGRKLSTSDMKQIERNLAKDLEQVASAVSLAVVHDKDHTWCFRGKHCAIDHTTEKVGTAYAERIMRAVSSAVLGTTYLRRLMPIGVIIGSSLAALRKYFDVAPRHENGLASIDPTKTSGNINQDKVDTKNINTDPAMASYSDTSFNNKDDEEGEEAVSKNINNDGVMVGAVTAALGASALLVQQQNSYNGKEPVESSSKSLQERGNSQKMGEKIDEALTDKHQNNIVTSLAEKAMSVAGPVVPTKGDGELDHERLVVMLAELGQKGGILRLVGKIALLWGGIRGAMSLTDRLISFLRIAERPLYQRILGFVGMVLVLWSPVIVPLLPTLVQSWTTRYPSRFAELVSIVGLYAAIMLLVMLWGRRIRGHENPLKQYGLDITTPPQIQSYLRALFGGVMLVISIQVVNALLGCVNFSWPSNVPPSSLHVIKYLQRYGRIILLAGQGILTATGVVLVEELLFRSWLPEEIAADLGYHRGIIISGLVFSFAQRSPLAIPGHFLLSLALAGFRQRSQGSLSVPIGLRAGIMASSFVLQSGGFLTYKPNFPLWITGTHPFQPFSGLVGVAFSLVLAIIVYPKEPLQKKKLEKTIQE